MTCDDAQPVNHREQVAGTEAVMATQGDPAGGVPAWIEPMLATPDGGRLPSGPEWAYEYKLDGYRACMRIAADGTTVLTSRNGIDFTDEFADLATVLAPALGGQDAVLDGEVVAYSPAGRIDFERMQERRGRYQTHRSSIRRDDPFASDIEVRLILFDLLHLAGQSLLAEPYDERRARLAALPMPDPYRVSVVRAFTFTELDAERRTPANLLEHASAAGYEGLVAKRRSGTYQPGRRSDGWRKHPLIRTTEVIVCGYRPGQGRIAGRMGGLALGAPDPDTGDLVYIGDVGTGFSEADRSRLQARLEPLERRTHPFAVAPPRADVARARWVEPELVGEVVFRTFTSAGRVRHTAWRGLREDRVPDEVVAPGPVLASAETAAAPDLAGTPAPVGAAAAPTAAPTATPRKKVTVQAGNRRLTLSNLDKPLYADGYTKGEVINYYSHIADVHPLPRRRRGGQAAVLREERPQRRPGPASHGGRRLRGRYGKRGA
ncbi:non-homologous end-joining DNA ligase [Amycolatopsis kentuckyensis]|uniref:non-homologous end-joining DNA ligase n=1 Tax=Amycolatopsis kentuckyensis TaxID=218823 RepID=UPI00356B4404